MARRFSNFAGLIALGLLAGCVPSDPGAMEPVATVMALDTSASAQEIHEQLYKGMLNRMENMKKGSRLILFRFDSSPAEFYDDVAIIDQAEAGMKLKPELQRQSETTGTNLARLFSSIENVIQAVDGPVAIHVYTDCGTEEMQPADDAIVKEMVQKWHARGVTISFHGVQSGHRERIRELVAGATIH